MMQETLHGPDLAQRPTPWHYRGKDYLVAATDLDLELLYQSVHEAWARNRIEARKKYVTAQAYQADLAEYHTQVNTNRFAFGGFLSLGWLTSAQGQFEYLLLKLQKGATEGGANVQRAHLEGVWRDDPEEWRAMAQEVLQREFPFLFKDQEEEHSTTSQASDPQSSSTNGSASCSQEEKCPAPTY